MEKKCRLKIFLFLALVDISFCGATVCAILVEGIMRERVVDTQLQKKPASF